MKKNTALRTAGAFFLVIGGLAIAAAPAQANEAPGAGTGIPSSITWQTTAPIPADGSITWQSPVPDASVLDSITWQVVAPGLPNGDNSITWQ
ncbi:hypothetical protein [Streptomyces kurssanovii]|uniref:Uncharacterized protein n=1 Tax=Streptomyces kurssanovii TaxID=67312 RepID=A0ABV3HMA9_9ACTN